MRTRERDATEGGREDLVTLSYSSDGEKVWE